MGMHSPTPDGWICTSTTRNHYAVNVVICRHMNCQVGVAMKMRHALAVLGLAACFVGCGDADEGVLESFAVENEILTTFNGDLALLGSYHEIFDSSADTVCARYQDGGKYARVTEPARELNLDYVRSKEELAQKVGVDLGVKARYGIVKGNGAVGVVNAYSNASDSATYLLSAQADYVVRDAESEGAAVVLSKDGLAALAEGPATFARRCGTHYASAVRYGARFYMLITFKATDHMTHTQMNASLGLDGATGAAGDLKTRLEKTSKMAGVNVTVSASSSGFWLDGKPANEIVQAISSGSIDKVLPAATQLYFAMSDAVQNEYCLDAGEGVCKGGQKSPGYFQRSKRDVSVTGVQLGAYASLSNAGSPGTFTKIKERTDRVRRFLAAYSELEVDMDGIYRDEIEPFMNASEAQKAYYNVAPPGQPLRSPAEVYQVAKQIRDLVYPPTAGVMGSLRQKVLGRIGSCLDSVGIDITTSCTAKDTKISSGLKGELEAEQTVEWNQLRAQLDDFVTSKRIVPLDVVAVSWAIAQGGAPYQCDLLAEKLNYELKKLGSSTKVVYRLAKADEVKWLAPVLGYGSISWTSASIAHATWYQPPSGQNPCGGDDQPFYRNEPGGAFGYACAIDDWWDDDLVPVCVPASGPIPVMPAG
jgi:hypothetical protein